jgi:hypothetical protein
LEDCQRLAVVGGEVCAGLLAFAGEQVVGDEAVVVRIRLESKGTLSVAWVWTSTSKALR